MQPRLLKTIIWFIVAILVSLAVQTPMIWHGEYYFLFSNLLILAQASVIFLTFLKLLKNINQVLKNNN